MNERTDSPAEIERKFLVEELPPDLKRYPSSRVRQGYLAIAPDGTEARIREQGDEHFLTLKSGRGRGRTEAEMPISEDLFDALWPLTRGLRVRKVRYRVPHGERTIEVDVYRRKLKGLTTAEVEFPSEEAASAFQPPDWVGPEITGNEHFSNQNLARHGTPAESLTGR